MSPWGEVHIRNDFAWDIYIYIYNTRVITAVRESQHSVYILVLTFPFPFAFAFAFPLVFPARALERPEPLGEADTPRGAGPLRLAAFWRVPPLPA